MSVCFFSTQSEAHPCLYSQGTLAAIVKAVARISGTNVKGHPRCYGYFHANRRTDTQCRKLRKSDVAVINVQRRTALYGYIRHDTSAIPAVRDAQRKRYADKRCVAGPPCASAQTQSERLALAPGIFHLSVPHTATFTAKQPVAAKAEAYFLPARPSALRKRRHRQTKKQAKEKQKMFHISILFSVLPKRQHKCTKKLLPLHNIIS